MNNLKTSLKNTEHSPLLRFLTGGLVTLAVIDFGFLGYLGYNIFNAESAARNEYQTVRAAQTMSELADAMLMHRRVVDRGRLDRKNTTRISERQVSARQIVLLLDTLEERQKAAHLDMSKFQNFRAVIENMLATTEKIFLDSTDNSAASQNYLQFLMQSRQMYAGAMEEVRSLSQSIAKTSNFQPPGNTQSLIILALAINILAMVVIALLMQSRITKPIINLAANCQKLLTNDTIKAPTSIKNEINDLQMTFHELSELGKRSEVVRRSYLQHLQDVQSAALTVAKKDCESIFNAPGLRDTAKTQFDKMRRNIDGMLLLLQQLSDAINFNPDKPPATFPTKTNVETLLKHVSQSIDWLLAKKKLTLNIKSESLELECDSALIERVLTNLLSNAIKYSNIKGEILLASTVNDRTVRFEIIDKGPGIAKQDQQKLFKKFSQLTAEDGVKRGGSGLGLMIARQIVEAHGGTIGCDSEPGEGANFWFTLPIESTSPSISARNPVDLKNKSGEPQKTIMTKFIALFSVFVIIQGLLAFKLADTINHAQEATEKFSAQKRIIVESQDIVATFIYVRQKAADAMFSGRYQLFLKIYPQLESLIEQTNKLQSQISGNEKLSSNTKLAIEGLKGIQTAAQSLDLSKPASIGAEFAIADQKAQSVETALFSLLRDEVSELDNSFETVFRPRQELFFILIAATVLNISVLVTTLIFGGDIKSKIEELNKKARNFALGSTPEYSIEGNDELEILDKSLCSTALTIRQYEEDRRNLMAAINHDLRAPLSSLLIGLEMVAEGMCGDLSDESLETVSKIEKTVGKLLSQVNDLLDIEKFEAGEIKADLQPINVADQLGIIAEKTRREIKGSRIALDLVVEESAKDKTAPLDEAMFERIISAVIENAVTATKPGEKIRLELTQQERSLRIAIEDQGNGISPSLQAEIFDRFRISGGKPAQGLGLPLARCFAESINCKIAIANTSSDGTTFSIFVPQ